MKSAWIMGVVQQRGAKITPLRIQIAEWIEKHEGVFSVQAILEAFPTLDKVTIYRTIELFTELDIVHPTIQLDGQQYFELHQKQHHHHAICTNCHKTKCIDCPVQEKPISGFRDLHHAVNFTGLCVRCA